MCLIPIGLRSQIDLPHIDFLEIGFTVYFFRFPVNASLSLMNNVRNSQIIQATTDLTLYSYSDRNNVYAKSTI